MAKKQQKTKKSISRKTSNLLITIAAMIIIIPVILLLWVVIDTKRGAGEPVIGNRFDNELSVKIQDEELKNIESSAKIDGVENVTVVLKSATLRLNVDVQDDLDEATMNSMLDEIYEIVDTILPVETYFTNQGDTKMYDLEINIYHFIPNESSDLSSQIHIVKLKTGAAEEPLTQVMTSPKNKEVADELMNKAASTETEEE